jgi:hypothetical protein
MTNPAPPTQTPAGPAQHRSLNGLRNLPRSATLSQFRAALEQTGQTPSPNWPTLSLFSPSAWLQWFRTYGFDAWRHSCQFRTDTGPLKSVYPLRAHDGSQTVRVSMAGDWGTGTNEAQRVADGMVRSNPHYTIHLGDVYYIGDAPSIGENCLGKLNPKTGYTPVKWPLGSRGGFAMNGNHEMYATGEPYFADFLPKIGFIQNDAPMGQFTSFFCLENDYWRIVALDTGYNSRGVPFLSMLGGIFEPSCRLPGTIPDWMINVLQLRKDDRRGLILLSHHEYYSLFKDHDYTKPAEQLADIIKRPVLWFWGHEHRFAGYSLFGPKQVKAHGRCIGHGGMPVSRCSPPANQGDKKLLFYDNRVYTADLGMNGYVTLAFSDARLTVQYHSLAMNPNGLATPPYPPDDLLIEEVWTVDQAGELSVTVAQKYTGKDFYGPASWGG